METTSSLNLYVLLTMLLLACGVAIVTKWIRLPYSIALVIVGLAVGVSHAVPVVTMTPDLIMLVFLPVLLFEAAWHLKFDSIKSCARPVSLLATVGVLISAVVVAAILHYLTGLEFKLALVFGAMISATDPISVLALFKKLRVEPRLHTLLEGESLLNDGTAVVLFRVLLASILATGDVSWLKIEVDFLIMAIGGTLIGAAVGNFASRLTSLFDDHLLETTLTVLVAYGSYLLAEQMHVSSVISVLVAGFIMGNFGSRKGMSATTRLAVSSFWEYAVFIAESFVFLLIGMQIKFELLAKYAPMIAAGIVAILVARMVVVYGLMLIGSDKKHPVPLSWQHLLFWGGLRGSLCMAMALSLPADFPQREMLVVTTFGVALFTLLIPGLTMEALVDVLKVSRSKGSRETQLEREIERLDAETANLKNSKKSRQLSKKDCQEKLIEIETMRQESMQLLELLQSGQGGDDGERLRIETALIRAQRECLGQLLKEDNSKPEILQEFRESLDSRYLEIRS
ncbi:MAG: Na+/H+ antiporter [Cyanobacteria bacterium DS2.3.42]|nr:Na+/H+ antiporter [Cyanobacteria bacterium DS2.3.42]